MDVYAIFCPDGALSFDDMEQCQREKWVPIATLTVDNKIHALIFNDPKIAQTFIRRNYPKNWIRGLIALSNKELQWMQGKGWEIKCMTYPNILKDTAGFGFEILEFQTEPTLKIGRS